MTPAKLRELASAVDPLAVLVGASLPSGEPVTTLTIADALDDAAEEIERLTAALRDVRSAVLHRKAVAPIVDAALAEVGATS